MGLGDSCAGAGGQFFSDPFGLWGLKLAIRRKEWRRAPGDSQYGGQVGH